MEPIDIQAGLRKLEFQKPDGPGLESTHAVVEFVREVPLADGQPVRISLGSRNGVPCEIVGLPQLVTANNPGARRRNYRYHLRGAITPCGPINNKAS
jgi:hypothetical protein